MPKIIKEFKVRKRDVDALKNIYDMMIYYDKLWKNTHTMIKKKYGVSDEGSLRISIKPDGTGRVIDLDQKGELETDLEGTLGGNVEEIQYISNNEYYSLKNNQVQKIESIDYTQKHIDLVPEGIYMVKGSTLRFLLKSQLLHKDKMYQEMV